MVQELRAGSAPITYVKHPDNAGPLAKIEGGKVYHYVNDHLGTPQEIHDGRGDVVWAADTSAYGKTRSYLKREIDNPIRFPGQYYDAESGLHYNRYRYYDPMAGRYINQDPIGLDGGINQYAYVLQNPVTSFDPDGLLMMSTIMGARKDVTLDEAAACGSPGNAAMISGLATMGAGATAMGGVYAARAAVPVVSPMVAPVARVVRKNARNITLCTVTGLACGGGLSKGMESGIKPAEQIVKKIAQRRKILSEIPAELRRNTGTIPK